MKPSLQACAVAVVAVLCAPAQAVQISAGTSEVVTMRTCSVSGESGCDVISRLQSWQYGGLPGDSQSTAELSLDGYGFGRGSVSLSGVIGAPILKASAYSEPGARISTNSAAVQRYKYEGDAPATRTFGGNLTYAQQSTGAYPSGSGIRAYLEVFSLPTESISIDPSVEANYAMLSGGYANLSGYSSLGFATFQDGNSNASGNGILSVTIDIHPGDAIWVWAMVQTPATNGGWVDSSHTFVTAWDETSSLTPAVVAIPEPGALAMMLSGMTFLVALSRTRQLRTKG
jgi:hypothetical protein